MSKRAEEAAMRAYPKEEGKVWTSAFGTFEFDRNAAERRGFQGGYEQAEQDLGWHSVEESLPEMDEEVIVLTDELNIAPIYKIAFGHIVDRNHCSDYNGWNIPGVRYWMPCPKIPEEEQ